MRVVKKKNAARLLPPNLRAHVLHPRRLFPIHAVHRPQHDGKPQVRRDAHGFRVIAPVGRPHETRNHAKIGQKLLNAFDLLPLRQRITSSQRHVRKRMVGHFMALFLNAPDNGRILFRPASHNKKCGRNAPPSKNFQQSQRVASRPVVKGDGAQIISPAQAEQRLAVKNLGIGGRFAPAGFTIRSVQSICPAGETGHSKQNAPKRQHQGQKVQHQGEDRRDRKRGYARAAARVSRSGRAAELKTEEHTTPLVSDCKNSSHDYTKNFCRIIREKTPASV